MSVYIKCPFCNGTHRFSVEPKVYYKCGSIVVNFDKQNIISEVKFGSKKEVTVEGQKSIKSQEVIEQEPITSHIKTEIENEPAEHLEFSNGEEKLPVEIKKGDKNTSES